jgi:hypothetical protein
MAETKPFEQMTPAEKRVAIAQDVIRHMDAKRIIPLHGTFLAPYRGRLFEPGSDVELSDALKTGPVCECCQVGAMMYSAVLLADALKVSELESSASHYGINSFDIWNYLAQWFTDEQLNLIEYTFEGGNGATSVDEIDDAETCEHAEMFHDEYDDEGHRMRAICENIIANGGEFVLPVAVEH